jgi:hypothetical protein
MPDVIRHPEKLIILFPGSLLVGRNDKSLHDNYKPALPEVEAFYLSSIGILARR